MGTLQENLDSLIRLVSNVTDAFTAALFLPDETGSYLKLTSFHSLSYHIQRDVTIGIGHGLIGWVAQTKENLYFSDFKRDTRTLLLYSKDEEIKSFLAVPVMLRDSTGVLCIDSKNYRVFPTKTEKILTEFAQEFSRLLMTHSDDLVELSDLNQRLSTQLDISKVLETLVSSRNNLIPHDGVLVVLGDKIRGCYSVVQSAGEGLDKVKGLPVSLPQSLVGWVINNSSPLKLMELKGYPGRTYILNPQEPKLRVNSFLGVPLVVAREVLGGWVFLSKKSSSFNDYHIRLASLIASQAATTLAYHSLRKEWQKLTSIDPSTGVYNFRQFVNTIAQRSTQGTDYQLLIIELECRSQSRDYLSPIFWEGIAQEVVPILLKQPKQGDIISRSVTGGFLLALAHSDPGTAFYQAETIKRLLEEAIFLVQDREVRLLAAIGITYLPPFTNEHEVQELLLKSIAAFNSDRKKNQVVSGNIISTLSV
jgi:transcriptional regulator with GAF, ATPase, and Fis domain